MTPRWMTLVPACALVACAGLGGSKNNESTSQTSKAQTQAASAFQRAADAQKQANEEQAKAEKAQADVTAAQKALADAQARAQGQQLKAKQAQQQARYTRRRVPALTAAGAPAPADGGEPEADAAPGKPEVLVADPRHRRQGVPGFVRSAQGALRRPRDGPEGQ